MHQKKLSGIQKILLKKNDRRAYEDYKLSQQIQLAPHVDLNLEFDGPVHFKHSGNAGDVIYALPSIIAIAKKNPVHLHLNPGEVTDYGKGVKHPSGNVMLTNETIQKLIPLLKYQQGIDSCDVYLQQPIDVDLDLFRKFPLFKGVGNIARWYFYVFGIQADLSIPWMQAPYDKEYSDCVVLSRSARYRNPGIHFGFLKQYAPVKFLGLPQEYDDMKTMLPGAEFVPVDNFLEMATIINSCRLFVGNQSFPFSIAEALKVKRVLEVCYYCPNVNVEGKNGFDFCYQDQFEKIIERALSAD